MRFVRLTFLLVLTFLLGAAAQAQSVRWEPADAGMPNAAVLVFESCTPDGQPTLPTITGVSFTLIGQTESTSIVNFQMTRSLLLTYLIRARQNTPVQIPSFTVKTDKGVLRVPAYSAASPGAPLESVASSKLVPERTSVWAGEVFGLSYELSASRRTNPQISPTFDWNAAPLVSEDWSKPEVTEVSVGGERRLNVVFKTRAVAKAPNTLKLETAQHLLSIQTGTIGFGIISQPRMEQVSVTSDQPVIEVRALPQAPPGFSGAVGQFKLTSKIVPEKAAVGEPITWTLELTGTGNWPDIAGLPSREVSNDFRVVQPKAKRTPAEGKLFDVALAEDVVLVPTKAGAYTLGPIAFTYFDPRTGKYATLATPRTTVTISPAVPLQLPGMAGTRKADTVEPPAETAPIEEPVRRPVVSPAAPAGIPRDPLPGSAVVRAPLQTSTVWINLIAPVAAVFVFWLWLAIRRAKQTDPVRPRREARDRLAKTLQLLGVASNTERPALLLAWQRDTAILWQLSHAAPRAAALPDPIWAGLWSDVDRALYGAKTAVPTDWVARAQEALALTKVPGFKPLRVFLPQNLMPFAAAIAGLLLIGSTLLHAAALDGTAAYRKGDFTAAEQAWRQRGQAQPTDWIARHNLSLALAQLERPTESAAQAVAAFVQNPADPSVRWHFGLSAEKAGVVPTALSGFVTPGPRQSLARLASPATWQAALIGGAWLAALAVGTILFNAYGRRQFALQVSALAILVLSIVLAGSATAGVVTYGLAAKSDAVVVARATTLRSIPTEADLAQKTTPLAAGSLALAAKTFLGDRWVQLAFDNGQTGWVRKEEVVALWK